MRVTITCTVLSHDSGNFLYVSNLSPYAVCLYEFMNEHGDKLSSRHRPTNKQTDRYIDSRQTVIDREVRTGRQTGRPKYMQADEEIMGTNRKVK